MENNVGFRPLGRRVVVRRLPKNSGGFVLTREVSNEGHPDVGVITAVGNLRSRDILNGIEPGKTIYYTRYSPVKIPVEGDEELDYYFVDVVNILGIKND